MTEESSNNSFFKDMMRDAFEKDPEMAMQLMIASLKIPVLTKFIDGHKDELNETLTITMTAGEALFLFAACKQSIGSMGNNSPTRNDGQLHVHLLKSYQSVGMKLAKLVGKIGYPEMSAVADMAGAIASVDIAFEKVGVISDKINSGEMTFDDMIGREVQ